MYYTRFDTRFCEIILVGDEQGISKLHLKTGEGKRNFEISNQWILKHDFFEEEIKQIEEYLSGKRIAFNIKLNPEGTDFQKRVWFELCKIPYGKVCSYKQLATNIGNEKASRAVGMANSKNPIPLIMPCHRVIGANGKLTGFAHGLVIKEKMINFEKLMIIFEELLKYYGKQNWWPAESDFEMMVGAILTQNTSWKNVKKSLDNFNGNLSAEFIRDIAKEELAEIIRPSGYFNQKALKLKALNNWYEGYDFNIEKVKDVDGDIMRDELLEINGVGKETADCIMTYAIKKPFFIIDTYTKRLFHRIGINITLKYDELRQLVENSISKDLYIYNEFHALIVKHATQHCLKTPRCEGCPLGKICKKRHVV